MRVPRLSFHRDKATSYLLDLNSKRGASKAKFFLARGFDRNEWLTFARALAEHALNHRPGRDVRTRFGEKHVVSGPMLCPDDSTPEVLSVWMLTPDGTTTAFVTAYRASDEELECGISR